VNTASIIVTASETEGRNLGFLLMPRIFMDYHR
jgi:hypothetical protein